MATTDTYLMVIKTTYENDKGVPCSGFTSRMGSKGSMPRLLRLRPEDTARSAGRPLQKGKFSWITESGQNERWIVASCGGWLGPGALASPLAALSSTMFSLNVSLYPWQASFP